VKKDFHSSRIKDNPYTGKSKGVLKNQEALLRIHFKSTRTILRYKLKRPFMEQSFKNFK